MIFQSFTKYIQYTFLKINLSFLISKNSIKLLIIISLISLNGISTKAQRPTIPGFGGGGFPGMGSSSSGSSGSSRPDGKMLNDSAQNIYGPTSTRYFYEADVFNNRKLLRSIDTTLSGFHHYNFLQRFGNIYTDLGNLGTAVRNTFFETPDFIGARLGQSAYDLYARNPANMAYFDTKSPYTNMHFTPGGSGQNILDFDFTRNIKPNINGGFNVRRITAIKQYGPPNSGEDNLLGTWDVNLNGNYYSKDKKYTVLGYLQYFQHKENDQGGISLPKGWKADTVFKIGVEQMASKMKNTSSVESRNTLHIYQEYKLANGFQAYLVNDYQVRKYKYLDLNFREHLSFYHPNKKITDTTQTSLNQQNSYSLFENKAGIKGFYKGFNYRLHLRRRDYVFQDSLGKFKNKNNENFLGLWLNYYFPDSLRRATASLEVGNDQQLKVEYFTPKFNAGFVSMSYSPSLLQQLYVSRVQEWNNNFQNTFVSRVYISTTRLIKKVVFSPSFEYNLIKNYVYFDSAALPVQTAVPFSIFKIGTGIDWKSKRFEVSNQLYINRIEGNDVLRIPAVFINTQLAYNFKYAKVLFVQTGLDFHYRSSYKADYYNPLTQSFYLNQNTDLPAYLVVDAFAVFRINRVRIFVKMSNVGQGVLQQGSFVGPLMPLVGRTFGYGVKWLLFD